jgi:ABC-type transport system substrate-binding protein
MARVLGAGVSRPSYYNFWFPGFPGYDESLPRREFDLAKARQLLAEAGYPNGVDLEIKVINRPVEVQSVEMLQGMYAKAGIRAKIMVLERSPWLADAASGNYEAISHNFAQNPDPLLLKSTRTGSTLNWAGYSRLEVDKLWDQASAEYDEKRRAEIFRQIQRIVNEDGHYISGFQHPGLAFVNKRVRGMGTSWTYRYMWLEG